MREDVIKDLENIVGKENVVIKREQMEGYLVDETAIPVRPQPAADVVLVKPANTQEVSSILKLANREKFSVFPRGGGTGLVGGCIPTSNGVILSTERMGKIEIDKDNLMAVADAGVTFGKLLSASEEYGLFFPAHPGDEGAHVGGIVATNAGGSRAVKYGVVKNYVKGLEVVLPTGEIMNFGGKLLKNNTGYDFMHLMINNEGTLGVITKVIFRLYPLSAASVSLVVPYNSRHDAINTVPKILSKGFVPLAIEYFDRDIIEESSKHLGKTWPSKEGEAYLYIIETGTTEDEVLLECDKIASICKESGSLEPICADSREDQDLILKIRSNIYTSIKADTADILDTTVPPTNIGKLMDEIDRIAKENDMRIPLYGHAADGNLHSHIMKEGTKWCPQKGRSPGYIKKVKNEIYKIAIKLGGVITGEHGIGKIRIENLDLNLSEKEIELMKGLKSLFDPNNILNPGTKVPI